MSRTMVVLLVSCTLTGCVAAIGNKGYGGFALTEAARPLLEERVQAARRVLELRQRRLDEVRSQFESGAASAQAVAVAEIEVEEARIRLLQFRAELISAEEIDD